MSSNSKCCYGRLSDCTRGGFPGKIGMAWQRRQALTACSFLLPCIPRRWDSELPVATRDHTHSPDNLLFFFWNKIHIYPSRTICPRNFSVCRVRHELVNVCIGIFLLSRKPPIYMGIGFEIVLFDSSSSKERRRAKAHMGCDLRWRGSVSEFRNFLCENSSELFWNALLIMVIIAFLSTSKFATS
jgi:hypothetical protein